MSLQAEESMQTFWLQHFSPDKTAEFVKVASCQQCGTLLPAGTECEKHGQEVEIEFNRELIAFFAASEKRRQDREIERLQELQAHKAMQEDQDVEWVDPLDAKFPLAAEKLVFTLESEQTKK